MGTKVPGGRNGIVRDLSFEFNVCWRGLVGGGAYGRSGGQRRIEER